MNCLECGGVLSTINEYSMQVCECCAEKLGLFEVKCISCGGMISSEEYDAGNGVCYVCINDMEDDV